MALADADKGANQFLTCRCKLARRQSYALSAYSRVVSKLICSSTRYNSQTTSPADLQSRPVTLCAVLCRLDEESQYRGLDPVLLLASERRLTRASWHPTNDNLFATVAASDRSVYLYDAQYTQACAFAALVCLHQGVADHKCFFQTYRNTLIHTTMHMDSCTWCPCGPIILQPQSTYLRSIGMLHCMGLEGDS